jgi:hypothetical protein
MEAAKLPAKLAVWGRDVAPRLILLQFPVQRIQLPAFSLIDFSGVFNGY